LNANATLEVKSLVKGQRVIDTQNVDAWIVGPHSIAGSRGQENDEQEE
jgi:hypothetical protein